MKTDTDDTIRVTVTFRRESNPEWYECLIGVRSGRARAEIVRSALARPRARPASSLLTSTVRQAAPAPGAEPLTVSTLTPPNDSFSKPAPIVNSSEKSTEATGALEPFDTQKNLTQQSVENNSVNNSTTKIIRRSGMAAGIFGAGEVIDGGLDKT